MSLPIEGGMRDMRPEEIMGLVIAIALTISLASHTVMDWPKVTRFGEFHAIHLPLKSVFQVRSSFRTAAD